MLVYISVIPWKNIGWVIRKKLFWILHAGLYMLSVNTWKLLPKEEFNQNRNTGRNLRRNSGRRVRVMISCIKSWMQFGIKPNRSVIQCWRFRLIIIMIKQPTFEITYFHQDQKLCFRFDCARVFIIKWLSKMSPVIILTRKKWGFWLLNIKIKFFINKYCSESWRSSYYSPAFAYYSPALAYYSPALAYYSPAFAYYSPALFVHYIQYYILNRPIKYAHSLKPKISLNSQIKYQMRLWKNNNSNCHQKQKFNQNARGMNTGFCTSAWNVQASS